MARERDQSGQVISAAIRVFMGLPPAGKVAVGVVLLVAGVIAAAAWAVRSGHLGPTPTPGDPAPGGSVVLMVWNVENLFDDHEDHRNSIDEPFDHWFAGDPETRKLKYDHLAEIILKVNGGKGPDVFAGVEVETLRAAELLRDILNAKLPAGAARYEHVAMKELGRNAGRYMAPCVISRLPLDETRTKLLGSHNLRILETHVVANGADLWLVASHWTSQKSDDGTHKGGGRDKYAATIYAEYERVMGDNPDADFLVCGDFNTTPDSEPVAGELRVTGNRAEVVPTRTAPHLFGLLSGKPPDQFGTHYFNRPLVYDQIAVSPGLFDDRGWGCDPDSVRVPTDGMIRDGTRVRRPWRFGNPREDPQGRGSSDHFPVVVKLKVGPSP
ncbi:MAG: Endonuclease/exonuclease/phosphatase [Gemmataceae bacterium]|nr:Endonuclease/exonuclease/phosphatase [Gemmataceae bacterium]